MSCLGDIQVVKKGEEKGGGLEGVAYFPDPTSFFTIVECSVVAVGLFPSPIPRLRFLIRTILMQISLVDCPERDIEVQPDPWPNIVSGQPFGQSPTVELAAAG